MNRLQAVAAIFFTFFLQAANSQMPAKVTLLRTIASLKNLNEPSSRLEVMKSIGIPFLAAENSDSKIFHHAEDGSSIEIFFFKGGWSYAEYDVTFSKGECISISDLEAAYEIAPQREVLPPLHPVAIKNGVVPKSTVAWVTYFPKTDAKKFIASASLSDDERCVRLLSFRSS